MNHNESIEYIRQFGLTHGLSALEIDRIYQAIGREPTIEEMAVFSALWSEHCAYKSSKIHLAKLPTTGEFVLQGPGENAGAIDIGGGLAAVFKMESHNHPSYIEPFQGAATGVGGILRDIFTMGARPIALLNSLRFGAIDHETTPYLVNGVVAGISHYGNCMGIPNVGGETYFDASHNNNILVNVFAVGTCKHDHLFNGIAAGIGNPVYYVGAATGRDGIHGATMASEQFNEAIQDKRPSVQVGDPFREKLLLEACMELMQTDAIVGIQDMGAAGLTSSSVEMASRGNTGLWIDCDKIPTRESNLSAVELLLSESQERMLVVVKKGQQHHVERIFNKWNLDWADIGKVTDSGYFDVYKEGQKVCHLPVALLTSDAPIYERPTAAPPKQQRTQGNEKYEYFINSESFDASLSDNLLALLRSPNICSRRAIYQQYDSGVGLGTIVGPGKSDAAILRVIGTNQVLAISVDCNSRYCQLDPRQGAMLAVTECARNISCVGATPIAVTDCLNFGDPTNPEIMWQFVEAIEGISTACTALATPVISGNVSLYNASSDRNIFPTPTIAMVGRFDTGEQTDFSYCDMAFKNAGDIVMVLGDTHITDIGGSEFLHIKVGEMGQAPPDLNLQREVTTQKLIRELIAKKLIASAHDCAEGGLGVALVECCLAAEQGANGLDIDYMIHGRPDLYLFSESPSRIVVSIRPKYLNAVLKACENAKIPFTRLGKVSHHPHLKWADHLDISMEELRSAYESGLATIL